MKPQTDTPPPPPPSWREYFSRRHPPRWWPENEPWPPRSRHWRQRHNPFFRRLGCLFATFSLLTVAALFMIILFILNGLGVIHFSIGQVQWVFPVAGVFLAIFIIIFVLGGRNLRSVSMPLDDLLNASNRLADGDYTARVEEKGPPEVRSLAGAFNSMATRLQLNDRQRRAMLADVSHELRTPLTVIQGNIEGVLDGMYAPDETLLHSILEETQVLSRLIDDLRTLSLAESGTMQFQHEPTDLAALIRETVAAFQSPAQSEGVKLDTALAEGLTLLDLDPERIRQVLSNLIANALRYSPPSGKVRISLTESASSAVVVVQDNGPGISAKDLALIFDRFYKSADSRGMGLGLPIAKYIVEAHGGTIKAESEVGKGTTISFTLPKNSNFLLKSVAK
jgi:two-component system sensor histidine kinase BaeS